MDRIAILGMGPVGVSIGLGLRRAGLQETEIVGVDGDRRRLSKASRMEAVDRTTGSLKSAVAGAGLVVLDVPLSDTRDVLEAVGPGLDRGCVVTDTGTVKAPVMKMAEACLPDWASFVGGHPLPSRPLRDQEDAAPSVFEDTDYCVVPAETAEPDAVRTVVGMVEALGARPFFLDPSEHDAWVAAAMNLPALVSRVLMNATTTSASWRDMSRLAASEFADVSRPSSYDPEDAAAECLANRDALLHWIDRFVDEVSSFREKLNEGNRDLADSFVHAWEEWSRWNAGAADEDSPAEIQTAAETMAGMVVGRRLVGKYRQIRDAGRREPRNRSG